MKIDLEVIKAAETEKALATLQKRVEDDIARTLSNIRVNDAYIKDCQKRIDDTLKAVESITTLEDVAAFYKSKVGQGLPYEPYGYKQVPTAYFGGSVANALLY